MKLKAIDTLHVSSVGPDNIPPEGEFEVADAVGQNLIDRGLAVAVKAKLAPAVENKMEVAPANKAAPKRKAK
jgi:hypothetical protein